MDEDESLVVGTPLLVKQNKSVPTSPADPPNSSMQQPSSSNKSTNVSVSLNPTFFKKLFSTLRILRLFSCANIALFLLFLVICVIGAMVAVASSQNYAKTLPMLIDLQYKELMGLFVILFFITVIRSISTSILLLIEQVFAYRWRQNLTKFLLKIYFKDANYFTILNFKEDKIDNPDQRIASDANDFCANLASVTCKGLTNLITLVYVTYIMIYTLGTCGVFLVLVVLSVPIISVIYFSIVLPIVASSVYGKDEAEGSYRYSHARIREYSESMTFFKGFQTEKANVQGYFGKLVQAAKKLITRNFLITFYSGLQYYLPTAAIMAVIIIYMFNDLYPFQKNMSYEKLAVKISESYRLANQVLANVVTIFALAEPFSQLAGNLARVSHMVDTCYEIEKASQENSSSSIMESSDAVEFSDVTSYTPTGVLLTKDLTFKVTDGQSMVIMGPSGCGKSSLVRLLAGIWPISQGSITRPLTVGRDGIFFLPQRPYLIQGGLLDQIIYPHTREQAGDLSEAELMRIVKMVNLEYIVEKIGGSNSSKVQWDNTLSIGELQRLGIARLFYHRPKFAVLDESTSGLDAENEDLVYRGCAELGITCISVAHRVTVKQYHHQLLYLDGKGGWELSIIDKSQNYAPTVTYQSLNKQDFDPEQSTRFVEDVLSQADERLVLKQTDVKSESTKTSKAGFNVTTFKRLFRLLRMVTPPKLWHKQTALTVGAVITVLINAVSFLPAVFGLGIIMKLAVEKNMTVVFALVVYVGVCFLIALSFGVKMVVTGFFGVEWRRVLTEKLHEPYFKDNMFYKVIKMDAVIDNPDQRIAADVDTFTSALDSNGFPSMVFNMLLVVNTVATSLLRAVMTVGVTGPMLGFVYLGAASILQLLLITWASKISFRQDAKEGSFRFSLARLKEYAEQIALYSGKEQERRIVYSKFKKLQRNKVVVIKRHFLLQTYTGLMTGLSEWFSYVVIAASLYLHILPVPAQKTDLIAVVNEAATIIVLCIMSVSSFLELGKPLAVNIAAVSRIGQLLERMDLLKNKFTVSSDAAAAASGSTANSSSSTSTYHSQLDDELPSPAAEQSLQSSTAAIVKFDNVSCITPKEQLLVRGLSFDLTPGDHLLINGPSGCGKSSLLRQLGKLWPLYIGTIHAPEKIGNHGIFFLPQSPYMILGSLRQQVIYPDETSSFADEELLEILRRVNLEYIVERCGGWDAVKEWTTVLSPGEQQRLAMSRVLYHRPSVVILDESTAALDAENEEQMYKTCLEFGFTLVSVGHRDSIKMYHNKLLKLNPKTVGWELLSMKHEQPSKHLNNNNNKLQQ